MEMLFRKPPHLSIHINPVVFVGGTPGLPFRVASEVPQAESLMQKLQDMADNVIGEDISEEMALKLRELNNDVIDLKLNLTAAGIVPAAPAPPYVSGGVYGVHRPHPISALGPDDSARFFPQLPVASILEGPESSRSSERKDRGVCASRTPRGPGTRRMRLAPQRLGTISVPHH